jgi:serine/threonine protein kinase
MMGAVVRTIQEEGPDLDRPARGRDTNEIPAEELPTTANVVVARRYVLLNRLGAGGMGEVWRAHDQLTGQTVAVKVLLPSIAGAPAAELRFQREIEAMARLDHPRIVPVIDAGRDPVVGLFFVMVLHPGRPLQEVGAEWTDWRQMWPVVDRILETLAHAHARGVIHRDIKPDNILIDAEGEPVLLDFGVARLKDQARSGTSAHDLLGTVDYAAPEQATGARRRIGPWTDLYAFAIVLYEIICGRLPFWAQSPVQSLMIRLDHGCPPLEPRPNFATPVGLWAVLDHFMRPEIQDRLQHVADARRELAALAEAPLEVLRPGPPGVTKAPVPSSELLRHDTTMTDDEAEELLRRRGSRFGQNTDIRLMARPLEPPLRPAPLQGREALLGRLSDSLSRWIAAPQPAVLVVTGPPGCGKSRLVQEALLPWLAAGRLDGHRHFWPSLNVAGQGLRDLALSLAGGLGLELEAARDHLDWWLTARGADPQVRDRLLAWLAPRHEGTLLTSPAVSLRRMTDFLQHCTTRQPFVLWLDGLEALDSNVLGLVSAVRDARLPVLVTITTRNAQAPTGLAAPPWLAEATRALRPLPDEAMERIADDLVELRPTERRTLVAMSDGNPQQLMDVIANQRRRGLLIAAWPRWRRAPRGWRTP